MKQRKFIKDFKAGDIVHAHGGRFIVTSDARESQSHRPQAGHLKTAHGPSDCAYAPAKCIEGKFGHYFYPGSVWAFQGNLYAGLHTVE